MGRIHAGVIMLTVLLAGCAANEPHEAPVQVVDESVEPVPNQTTFAPSLPVGRAWTYSTAGFWDQVPLVTIVVADADEGGYLFAAQTEAMLEDEIAWDLPYLGWFTKDLVASRDEKYGAEAQKNQLLRFPLEPGKTWQFYDTDLTARPANVSTPNGDVAGWRILGSDAKRAVAVEYAPEVGFVTFYEERDTHGRIAWSLRLESVSESREWTWLKRNAEVVDGGLPGRPSNMQVTQQDDAVFAWGTGSAGSRGVVAPPGQVPWSYEAPGGVAVRKARLDPQVGTWTVTGVAGGSGGYVYTQLHAVEWVKPSD